MSLDYVGNDTTNRVIISTLNAVGIETPTLPETTGLPTGTTTRGDVVQAIRASKTTDPYTDPKVQKLYLATIIQADGGLYQSNQQDQAGAQRQVLLDELPRFRTELAELFDTYEETIGKHADLLNGYENLDDVRLNSDGPTKVHAAVEVQVALSEIAKVLTARGKLEFLKGGGMGHGGNTHIFEYANPTVDERARIQALGDETIWNTVRAGVELTMVKDSREMGDRIATYESNYQRIQRARAQQAKAERQNRNAA